MGMEKKMTPVNVCGDPHGDFFTTGTRMGSYFLTVNSPLTSLVKIGTVEGYTVTRKYIKTNKYTTKMGGN
jgi:hypothetical protein